MAISSGVYNSAKVALLNGTIDLDTDTIMGLLVTSSYTPDFDAHNYRDDVTAYEVSGTNYTAGGVTLGSKTVTQDNTNNRALFDGADLTYTNVTIAEAAGVILYKSRGGASSADELIACIAFGSNKAPTAQNLVVQWASVGILANA